MPSADTLVFTGDSANDTVVIYDNGVGTLNGSYTVAPGVMAAFGPVGGIRNVFIEIKPHKISGRAVQGSHDD